MLQNRLPQLRKEYGLTQDELANKLNITRSALSLYELGKRDPDTDTLNLFADFFDVSIDYLLGRSDFNNSQKDKIGTKTLYSRDLSGLPEEAIKQIDDYIELIKLKYLQEDK